MEKGSAYLDVNLASLQPHTRLEGWAVLPKLTNYNDKKFYYKWFFYHKMFKQFTK